jgi:hypothetical protein
MPSSKFTSSSKSTHQKLASSSHSKNRNHGGGLLSDVGGMAVPFALLLAKHGFDVIKTKNNSSNSSSSPDSPLSMRPVSANSRNSGTQEWANAMTAAKPKTPAAKPKTPAAKPKTPSKKSKSIYGGTADNHQRAKFQHMAKNIDSFMASHFGRMV